MEDEILSLRNLSKDFETVEVLNDFSIDISRGEFITLLGPSGCGKTTTLRLIAGLESLDSGSIILNGEEISNLPPNSRNVNTVFQNYALFPHMNVFDNIAYGLKIKNAPKDQIRRCVAEMLELVKMTGYEKRMPSRLSGGQRQRIAIARALINKPDILLLDEPLGALDLKLRQHMQAELKSIQAHTGITFVYVTHDQDEALNMSDHIVVMNNGRLEQYGTPEEIYLTPKTRFVAEFVGNRNILDGKVTSVNEHVAIMDVGGESIKIANGGGLNVGDKVTLAVHADRTLASKQPIGDFYMPASVSEIHYMGSQSLMAAAHEKTPQELRVVQYGKKIEFPVGCQVYITWDIKDGIVIKEGDRL